MSYQSEVLADTPVVFYRLDHEGFAVNGQTITDLSGNSKDAQLCWSNELGGLEPLGQDSAIETDTNSKGFRIFTDGSNPPGHNISYAFRSGDGDLSVTGDFTFECWIKLLTDDVDAITPFLQKKSQYQLQLVPDTEEGGSLPMRFSIKVWFADATTQTLTADSFYPFINTYYHVVGGRSGTTLFLRVNYDHLATLTIPAVNNAASGGAGTWGYCNAQNSALVIGPGTDGEIDAAIDECAFYDSALGASRILAHYQAAKNSLPLSVTIKVRAVLSLNTDQIIPLDFPFSHNWGQPLSGSPVTVKEILAYRTNENPSQPDYRQRVNAQPHHADRELEYAVTVNSANQRARHHAALWRPGETYIVPVWSDWTVLTAQATAGAGSVSLDTTKRDFEIGSYVGACSDPYDPRTYEFWKIASRNDTSLTFVTGETVTTTIANGSPVFPARLMTLETDQLEPTSHLQDKETFDFRFRVISTELSTRRVTAYTPTETYKSIERFTLTNVITEWLDEKGYQLHRRQEGGDDRVSFVDTGSPRTFPVRVLLTTRAAISEFFGWLDARQGKQNPLWISSGEADMVVTASSGGTSITITSINYTSRYNLHHARRDIEFLKTNGTYVRRRITGATDGGATETLTLNGDAPVLADISKVSFLRYCVCASDIFELEYQRDLSTSGGMIATCQFAFRELLTSPA